jgi:hypothetical protein
MRIQYASESAINREPVAWTSHRRVSAKCCHLPNDINNGNFDRIAAVVVGLRIFVCRDGTMTSSIDDLLPPTPSNNDDSEQAMFYVDRRCSSWPRLFTHLIVSFSHSTFLSSTLLTQQTIFILVHAESPSTYRTLSCNCSYYFVNALLLQTIHHKKPMWSLQRVPAIICELILSSIVFQILHAHTHTHTHITTHYYVNHEDNIKMECPSYNSRCLLYWCMDGNLNLYRREARLNFIQGACVQVYTLL